MTMPQRLLTLLPTDIPALESELGIRLQPRHQDDVELIIRSANTARVKLYPWQQQTQPLHHGVFVDLSLMNAVRKYRASEFLIAVEAGMTLDQLAETANQYQQRLPLKYAASRTIGEVLGEATQSLSAGRHGGIKSLLMGLEAITGDGEYIHYGGELVKNVTGYDLNKLFCGSQHRYGIVTSAILKLEPQPEMSRAFLFHVEAFEQALQILTLLHQNLSTAEILTLFKTKTTFGWQILVSLAGYKGMVETESERVRQTVASLKADLQEMYLAPKALDQWIQRLDWTAAPEPEALVVRVALPHHTLAQNLPVWLLQSWFKSADLLLPSGSHQLHLRWISVGLPTMAEIRTFQVEVTSLGGFVDISRTPATLGNSYILPQPDPSGVLARWEQRLKTQYDPREVLGGSCYHEINPEVSAV